MNASSTIKPLFESPEIASLSRTSIFNSATGNSDVLYIKNAPKKSTANEGDRTPPKKFSPLNHLTELANNIKERKELPGKIKNFLSDRGITINKEIRSALPSTFNRGNSVELRSALKENLPGHEFIQMKFLSMMTSHINKESFSELLSSSNIFSDYPDILTEVNSLLQNEMSVQAKDIANDIFSAASKARAKYLAGRTNPEYSSSMKNLRIEANNEAFKAASRELCDKFSKIHCGSNFTALSRALAISLDKAIELNKPKSNSIDRNDIEKMKEKIIESLLLSSFTKVLTDEMKAGSEKFSGSIPFDALAFSLENSIRGVHISSNEKNTHSKINTNKKLKLEEVEETEKILKDMTDNFKFPSSFEKIKASLKAGDYSKFWHSRR